MPVYQDFFRTERALKLVNTVCKHAACPNRMECFGVGHAAFMILGSSCTRNCTFCNVRHALPEAVDEGEPERIASAARELALDHVVVTSVSRDDLADGGAAQFARTVTELRRQTRAVVEVLIPDFLGSIQALSIVVESGPDVIAHNLETVRQRQPAVRPQADYECSLGVLRQVKALNGRILTKSGLMFGVGETDTDVYTALTDLSDTGCDILTLGQYRQPSPAHLPVHRFILEEGFLYWQNFAYKLGFRRVFSGSYVRSSYRAGEIKDLLGEK